MSNISISAGSSNHSRKVHPPSEARRGKDSAVFAARAELLQESEVAPSLNNHYMIPLPAPDGRGEARAKRANQESNKCPQQGMRYRFAGGICGLLSLRKHIRHAVL